jgi:hypothetical protein
MFESMDCKGSNLLALARSIEDKYRNLGDLMDLEVKITVLLGILRPWT